MVLASHFAAYLTVMTRLASVLVLLLAMTACGGTTAPTGSSAVPSADLVPDAPFNGDGVAELGLKPGDIPGMDYNFEPDSLEPPGEAWREHLESRGFQGRWWADLLSREAVVFSRISLWGSARQASEAMAYESETGQGLRGRPVGPLTPTPGLGEEGWCQILERAELQDEATCRFRVANATIDIIGRNREGAVPYPLERVRQLAMLVSDRAEAQAGQ